MPKPSPNKRDTLSVSQLNRQAKRLLEGNFPSVWIEGELSNFATPSSGHWYFSLKDKTAQVRCAMFRSSNARLRFRPEAGDQVVIRAKLSLYEARGDYQLIAEHMDATGDGALARAFEELKNRLAAEGLFDPALKQALPELPRHIAVVTSASGAAIHDILTVLARRFAGIPVSIVPTAVQGNGAAAEIARAIELINQRIACGEDSIDVIIAGRGGGSMEDLWAFNEEIVARAIAASSLPVVSAVGHEVDFTIADFVADVRAPTPSAAAELLSPDAREWMENLHGYELLLSQGLLRQLEQRQQQLNWLRSRLRHPGSRLQEHYQRLDELEIRLRNSWHSHRQRYQHRLQLLASQLQQAAPVARIEQARQHTANQGRRLQQQLRHHLQQYRQRLAAASGLLDAVSPLATLQRGYSIISDDKDGIVSNQNQLKEGDRIHARLASGELLCRVEECIDDS